MIDFEEILENIMPDGIKFYWGYSDDLPRFLEVYGERHFPFVWSVPKRDDENEWGAFQRDAEINICTRETRELLNPRRLDSDKSYKSILYPIWKDLELQIKKSPNIDIVEGSISREKFPEFSSNDKNDNPEIWDVLNIRFTAIFRENNNC